MKNKLVKIAQQDEKPITEEMIAQSIVDISEAMKRIESTRLTRGAIVALIHDKSKIQKGIIHVVLNNLENLESIWLKKSPK